MIHDKDGKAVRIIGAMPRLTWPSEAEPSLHEAEERYRLLVELSPDAVLIHQDSICVYVNRAGVVLLGATRPEELLGRSVLNIVRPDFREAVRERVRLQVEERKAPPLMEQSYLRPDGSTVQVEVSAAPCLFHGKPAIQAIARDITGRKRAEEGLLRFRMAMETSLDGIFLMDFETGRYLDVNETGCRMLGYSRQELLTMRTLDTNPGISELDRQRRFDEAKALGSGHVMTEPEGRFMRRKDGVTFPIEVARRYLRVGGKEIVVGIARDITERKQSERSVRDSGKRFKAIFDQAPLAMALLDKQGHPIISNSHLSKMIGYSSDELSKMKFADFTYPEDVEKDLHQYTELMQGSISTYRMEKRYIHKNGNLVWADLFVTMLRDENGLPQDVIGMAEDITARKNAEQELMQLRRQSELILASVGEGIHSIDIDGKIIFENPTSAKLLGYSIDELSGRPAHATTHHSRKDGTPYPISDCPIHMTMHDGVARRVADEVFWRKDGSSVPVEYTTAPIRNDREEITGAVVVFRDISDRKKTDARIAYLNRVYAMLSGINTLIVRVRDGDVLFKEACRIAVEEGGFHLALIGIVDWSAMKIVPVASVGRNEALLAAINQLLSLDEVASTTMVARAIRGKKAVVSNDSQSDPQVVLGKQYTEAGVRSLAILPLIVSGEAAGVLALYANEIEFFHEEEMKLLTGLAGDIAFVIDHIDKQERLDYLAYYDELTGLANRRLFLERVAQYMRSAATGGHKLALFLIDLERFKNINDSLGRQAGDALLKQVAEWLTRHEGDANLVARLGADHFATVLPVLKPQDGARSLEESMNAFMEHPFRLNDAVFRMAAKVGVAVFPDDGADADTLYRNAEAALKKAKASGDRYLFYTQKMTAMVAGKLTLENQLRQALDKDEFVLYYQPKVNLASGKLTGAEALIRWNDPRTGLVPPGRFIPILEETGLIYEVGRWALRQAIADYLRWRTMGLPAVRVAVNVSPLQLRHRAFVAEIEQAIGIDAHASAGLELEITESLIMEDVKHSIASLRAIRAMGVSIAIDDFGTGFSSLSYLSQLPVDTMKIDRSFVIEMTAAQEGLALVSTIISLAHALKLKVVAEGVETEEQSRLLRLLNCDEMQGYLFSKPLPGQVFEEQFLVPLSAK